MRNQRNSEAFLGTSALLAECGEFFESFVNYFREKRSELDHIQRTIDNVLTATKTDLSNASLKNMAQVSSVIVPDKLKVSAFDPLRFVLVICLCTGANARAGHEERQIDC